MLLDLCKEFKIDIFVAVFHGVHSDYTILRIFTEEQHGPGGGVAEVAGVRVRHLGQGEPGPLPGRGKISTVKQIAMAWDDDETLFSLMTMPRYDYII